MSPSFSVVNLWLLSRRFTSVDRCRPRQVQRRKLGPLRTGYVKHFGLLEPTDKPPAVAEEPGLQDLVEVPDATKAVRPFLLGQLDETSGPLTVS